MAGQRMGKDERRQQLLEVAAGIVRSKGTDALTLATLAEHAGVTKPIAYEHFGTRSRLLMELYRYFDEPQAQAVKAALASNAKSIDDVIAILSTAYVDCVLNAGQEFGALAAALSATQEMEDFRVTLRDGYVEQYRKALSPYVKLPKQSGYALLVGILGAADALSNAAASGALTRAKAITALTKVVSGALADKRTE
jgi:AcrR family transcriptional regulator